MKLTKEEKHKQCLKEIKATLLVVLPEVLRFLSSYRMLIYAVVLIVIMLVTNNEKIRTFMDKLKTGRAKEAKES